MGAVTEVRQPGPRALPRTQVVPNSRTGRCGCRAFLGGSGCAGDGCEDPFAYAFLLFLVTAPVLLLVGGAVGCHLALRSIGDCSRRLTVALVPVLGLAALVLLPAGAFAVGAATPVPTLLILVPTLLFIVPFAAWFLATRRGGPPVPASETAPHRRAW